MPLFRRLSDGLARTREVLTRRLDGVFARTRIDDALFADLEEALLMADVGVRATARILDRLREDTTRMALTDPARLRERLGTHLIDLLRAPGPDLAAVPEEGPLVVLVVGVNGGGKTTTIGKLASRYVRAGHRVLVGAGDTFRAGAVEQLGVWAERAGAEIVSREEGADPAAVLFDAVTRARSRGHQVVICDTAGRLQSRKPLMDELAKVIRVIGRALPGAPHEVLLVLDATIGQNALSQARLFGEAAPLTGIVLTKLDGTARGGVVVAVCQETGLPVKLIGVGETLDDLRPFDPVSFVEALLAPEDAART
ncbi:MAG: signal recognition particle-docking protein FtsY [Deltaproteobacteria bacterium]|nr:signal recognition particle-docking protein FtsY [Deltaproteobacteria bacterium]